MIFSICIPTYNRAYKIGRALKSLENQIFSDFEVIVVDDGSTDNTYEYLQEYMRNSNLIINYIRKSNGGKYTALNVGIEAAKGEFFLILDSDDELVENALESLYNLWLTIPYNERINYSGVMGKCEDQNGRLLGNKFPRDMFISSYIDFHFITGKKHGSFGDCCEFIKTSILKQYIFPVYDDIKFIPESYLTDQIGIQYKLLCTNKIFKIVEYLNDGITKNVEQHKIENQLGYLIYYVCLLDKVFPLSKEHIFIRSKVIIWWKYWSIIIRDKEVKGLRCKKITLLGYVTFLFLPLINLLNDIHKKIKN